MMKYATILSIKSINNSINGNPAYRFELQEANIPQVAISGLAHYDEQAEIVTRRTSSDIMDCYGIIPNNARVGKVMAYEITRAGNISSVKAIE